MQAMQMDTVLSSSTGNITNITSYDVLSDPSIDGVIGEYQLENYTKNVGNNRLKVFLGLHQHDYDRACRQENVMACDSIVTNILDTLNKKCVPTGRFLVNTVQNYGSNNMQVGSSQEAQSPQWQLMGEYEAKQLIHGILKGVKPPDSYRYRQQQLQQQQQAAMLSNSDGRNGSDEHKRRRRSSLLRRSASESILDDSKKVYRFDQEMGKQNRRMSREEPIWSSSRRLTNNRIMSLNRMDVILTSTMDALDPNCQSIGNNRLHILVAMQSGKYQNANDRQKDAILDEVMQTVNSFWKGRFLTESMSGCYEELDSRDAKRSLRHIFDMRSGQSFLSQSSKPALNITPKVPASGNNSNQSDANKNGSQNRNDPFNMMRNASTSSILSGSNTLISNDTKKILSRQMSSSLIPNQTPSSATLSKIEPPVAVSGIDDLRSAAIRSLQKQKARQQVATRLEKVSMRNSQQQQQIQQIQQPSSMGNMLLNGSSNNGNSNPSFNATFNASFPSGAKRRQSSIFGALDPTIMDEIVDGCFDDE
eukprot:CAMPEP_0116134200 /NCGR_PEP_ID=MMETSP0329-20121206/10520_1 /TAXON_ID=697910 /ORGANISM="Pseudo-nitzschia arenysensis, Strain B593" /LENGTH=532 /DNA_ID=CAMNT_0003628897 /DNA_START=186 /DNA_END=1784 /DNA_ORIENTATION=-